MLNSLQPAWAHMSANFPHLNGCNLFADAPGGFTVRRAACPMDDSLTVRALAHRSTGVLLNSSTIQLRMQACFVIRRRCCSASCCCCCASAVIGLTCTVSWLFDFLAMLHCMSGIYLLQLRIFLRRLAELLMLQPLLPRMTPSCLLLLSFSLTRCYYSLLMSD